ncbi:peptidylprolyl isomerase [Serpentinicella sp. ANB-PHB4]|uniref:peptidylprolyl isomerase n=1 Tax=Serpentinicella sp. ANB-PHB4 TaxID=3074076 RepID=UPI00285C5439|nr:peptidylprolyl isomerase [Serpentinicella sp. ANB-PHB4]MDR5658736.1 peptidylprolyl isomerase [Serpentinicella sp. ANB-PHB4]
MNNNQVVATVGDREITQLDVELLLKSMDPQKAMHFNTPEGKSKVVQELVNQELFYLYALENALDAEEQYKAELENITATFLKQYAISKVLKDITTDDAEAETFFNENKDQFVNPESVKGSHILVEDESTAKDIIKEINEGLAFDEAAKKYSKCPSKAQGGSLGYFTQGKMVPEFEAVAFNMKQNEISEPVKTQFGYHIIKIDDKKEASEQTFDQVKDQIKQHLLSEKQQKRYFETIDTLKEKHPIKINE